MNTIIAIRKPSRETAADLLATAYERHSVALIGFFASRLETADFDMAEDLAGEVWAVLAAGMDRMDHRVLELDWLLLTARAVLRQHNAAAVDELVALVGFTGDEPELAVASELDDDGETELADEPKIATVTTLPTAGQSDALTFRRSHGDPDSWSAQDFDTYDHLAQADQVTTASWIRPMGEPVEVQAA